MQDIFPLSIEEAEFTRLETATNPCHGRQSIQIVDPEFSSVCPRTSMPDYGRVIVQYVPNELIVELKSFKLYLRDFYGVGAFHEVVTQTITDDFIEIIVPRYFRLIIDWGARGGLKTITGLCWTQNKGYVSFPEHWEHRAYLKAANSWTNG